MSKLLAILTLIAALGVAGCMSQTQFLQSMQANAMQTAVSRGQFEMNCPSATPTLISQEVVQPALQGPYVNGIQRAEYTIGVAGCGQRKVFVVCKDGIRVRFDEIEFVLRRETQIDTREAAGKPHGQADKRIARAKATLAKNTGNLYWP